MKRSERVAVIRDFLEVLLGQNAIAEIRVPKSSSGPMAGIFDDLQAAARAAAQLSGTVPGVYVTLNPLTDEFASQITNEMKVARSGVKDTDITARRWLPIDFDPVRTPGTPSSAIEHRAAILLARACRSWLRENDWPEPIFADSGNGAHLLYPIDLPNDATSGELIKNLLELFSLKFSNAEVQVDTGNGNSSRVWRVYGTFNCKGIDSEQRPYRRSKLLKLPREILVVAPEKLQQLSATLPKKGSGDRIGEIDLARWIDEQKVPVLFDATWKQSGHKWVLQCPWNESHTNKSAFIVRFPDGGVVAGCRHQSCSEKNWPKLRNLFEKRSGITTSKMSDATRGGKQPKDQQNNQVKTLLELRNESDLFCTPEDQAFATVKVNGHQETHRIGSSAFDRFLRSKYFGLTNSALSPQAVRETVLQFDALARFGSPTKKTYIRVAAASSTHYLDLGDDLWRSVRFDVDGWRVLETSAIKFRRTPGMLPLPLPRPIPGLGPLRRSR